MTVVVLLHKHFLSTPSLFFNSASINTNCKRITVSNPNITLYVTLRSPFLSQLIAFNFSSVPTVLHQIFVWIALGDADLHSSLMLLTKASAVEEATK
jgi:hypothetical protein